MNIPDPIKQVAKSLIGMYGCSFNYLGKLEGADFYKFKFPKEEDNGFPFVYQYEKGKEVRVIMGFEAYDVLDAFMKD
jgi:hypothetical protein